jgi:hypothetical protein
MKQSYTVFYIFFTGNMRINMTINHGIYQQWNHFHEENQPHCGPLGLSRPALLLTLFRAALILFFLEEAAARALASLRKAG